MGFLDTLLGRTKPVQANLDHLFGLPGARITLEACESLASTGEAAVCFKPTVGQDFAATEKEFTELLNLDDGDAQGTAPSQQTSSARVLKDVDEFGYQWVVVSSDDFESLVTRVHVVNSTLSDNGYGTQLLCSVFGFAKAESDQPTLANATAAASTYLVYLFKRGTFYPFVPMGAERRDNEAELRLKAELGEDLSIEADLARWFPIWKLPIR